MRGWKRAALVLTGVVAPLLAADVRPREDDKVLLHNPDMGWIIYENFPVDPDPHGSSTMLALPDEKWEMVDEAAIMFTWADIEKVEGKYDFTAVDRAYDWWTRHGKKIQLRMSTESLVWWNRHTPPAGLGVPPWLVQKLPDNRKQTRLMEGIEYTVVDARDPLYRQRLTGFLAEVRRHFGKERPVRIIDLRGFGVWGEWHSGYRYRSVEERHEALSGVIDLWSAAFPDHWLALSYSYDPDGPKAYYAGPNDRLDPSQTSSYPQFLHFSALDHGRTKPNLTWRRDGAGGAVHSNERKLCEEEFATLEKGPMIVEFLGGFGQNKKGGAKWVEFMIDDALSLHPNYINLLGWQGADALAFCRERPDLVEKGLRNMGYRLAMTRAIYPDEVRNDGRLKLEMEWANRGVGRAMRSYSLQVRIGQTVADAGGLGCDRWVKGKSYAVTKGLTLRDLQPGEQEVWIQVRDGDRVIGLAMEGEKGWYRVGKVTVR